MSNFYKSPDGVHSGGRKPKPKERPSLGLPSFRLRFTTTEFIIAISVVLLVGGAMAFVNYRNNLVTRIDPARDTLIGTWTKSNDLLSSTAHPAAIRLPVDLNGSFELIMRVRSNEAGNVFFGVVECGRSHVFEYDIQSDTLSLVGTHQNITLGHLGKQVLGDVCEFSYCSSDGFRVLGGYRLRELYGLNKQAAFRKGHDVDYPAQWEALRHKGFFVATQGPSIQIQAIWGKNRSDWALLGAPAIGLLALFSVAGALINDGRRSPEKFYWGFLGGGLVALCLLYIFSCFILCIYACAYYNIASGSSASGSSASGSSFILNMLCALGIPLFVVLTLFYSLIFNFIKLIDDRSLSLSRLRDYLSLFGRLYGWHAVEASPLIVTSMIFYFCNSGDYGIVGQQFAGLLGIGAGIIPTWVVIVKRHSGG